MTKLGSSRALAVAGLLGIVIGALAMTILEGVRTEISDAEIANKVLDAGELVTWEPREGEVCMRWGERFQACDFVREEPPPPIGLGPDDPPPTPLDVPKDS